MGNTLKKGEDFARNNIDKRIVVSTIAASFILGGIIFALNKSNVKALKGLAKVAK
ncbi:MAG: hypothetical protein HRU20_31705 [Pseudomonadales bacterium]|nr:hypothetical protein [Pseudomonadales bacterium]